MKKIKINKDFKLKNWFAIYNLFRFSHLFKFCKRCNTQLLFSLEKELFFLDSFFGLTI